MTTPAQLELVRLSPGPPPGEPLVAVRLPGEPARSHHRCTCLHGRPGTRPDPNWESWRRTAVRSLQLWWSGRDPIDGPVIASVVAVFPRPAQPRRWYTLRGVRRPYPYTWHPGRVGYLGRPDHDQVWKAGLDVCVHAGILVDDPLVVGDGGSRRWYAAEGEGPSVEIRLWAA